MDTFIFFWAIISFFSSFILTQICIKLAYSLNILDYPDGTLKAHKQPTPYLGGLGIFLALLPPIIIYMPKLLPGLSALLVLGLFDDIFRLPPWILILGHSMTVIYFLSIDFFIPISSYGMINKICSFFIGISIINAFNLVDVMDGLATVISLCMCLTFFIFSIFYDFTAYPPILSSLFGALLAFLFFNRPPARIYLGDAGSLVLGGFFSAITLNLNWVNKGIIGMIIPFLLLMVPAVEIIFLVVIRTLNGIPFYLGSPDHFSIYLQNYGWSKWKVLGYVSLILCLSFGISLLFFFGMVHLNVISLLILALLCIWFGVLL